MTDINTTTTAAEELEGRLIGAAVLHPDRVLPELLTLPSDAYTGHLPRRCADAIRTLHELGDTPTETAIAALLELDHHHRTRLLEWVAAAEPYAATQHVRRIRTAWTRRRTLAVLNQAAAEAARGNHDQALRYATEALELNTTINDTLTHIADALPDWLDLLEARSAHDTTDAATTGLIDLDKIIGGLRPGQLIVAAGRPGSGKTAFGGQLAVNASNDRPALVVSVEMATSELLDRWGSATSRIPSSKLRDGTFDQTDWPRISNAAVTLADLHLWIDDNPNTTVANIRAAARHIPDIGIIVVDYTQLLTPERRVPGYRQLEVAEISGSLKRLARELHIPVVALAQLNRECEQRADKRPQLSDLRESGALEQDADIVIGLYRDEYYHPGTSPDPGVLEAIVLKQRAGPTGTARLFYDLDHQHIADLAHHNHRRIKYP